MDSYHETVLSVTVAHRPGTASPPSIHHYHLQDSAITFPLPHLSLPANSLADPGLSPAQREPLAQPLQRHGMVEGGHLGVILEPLLSLPLANSSPVDYTSCLSLESFHFSLVCHPSPDHTPTASRQPSGSNPLTSVLTSDPVSHSVPSPCAETF